MRPPNHHHLQQTCETFHKWVILYYHEATIMIYSSNRASKWPYYPHIVQNIPLKPPQWDASQLNLPEMLLSTSPKTHRKARNWFLIPYQAVWCPPRAVVVTVHGSVSLFWCMWPPWKSCYRPPRNFHFNLGTTRHGKTQRNFSSLHRLIAYWSGDDALPGLLGVYTNNLPSYKRIWPPKSQKSSFSEVQCDRKWTQSLNQPTE